MISASVEHRATARPREAFFMPPAGTGAELPAGEFATQERADGLHIVDAAGHSWGIASTPAIAAAQVSAMGRIAQ